MKKTDKDKTKGLNECLWKDDACKLPGIQDEMYLMVPFMT